MGSKVEGVVSDRPEKLPATCVLSLSLSVPFPSKSKSSALRVDGIRLPSTILHFPGQREGLLGHRVGERSSHDVAISSVAISSSPFAFIN